MLENVISHLHNHTSPISEMLTTVTMAITTGKCIVLHKNHISQSLFVLFLQPNLSSISYQNDISPGLVFFNYYILVLVLTIRKPPNPAETYIDYTSREKDT